MFPLQQDHLLATSSSATSLEVVRDAIAALVARYRNEEVLTSVRHLAAREAKFQPMPVWLRKELAQAYQANCTICGTGKSGQAAESRVTGRTTMLDLTLCAEGGRLLVRIWP